MLDQQAAWDRVAVRYQREVAESHNVVHYGPWSPPEAELQVLGPVQGLAILELGCGGGQCAVALAQQGAQVVGLDVSEAQLAFARQRAAAAGVELAFVTGSAADLSGFGDETQDLILAVYVLPYVEPLERCLTECWRVLRPGGRLVFSLDHPLRDCFLDLEEQELSLYPVRDYFDETPLRWRFPGTNVPMANRHYPISGWIDRLLAAGFQRVRLVEPPTDANVAAAQWPEDSPLFPIRNLPQTVIFVAQKAATDGEGV
jgi:SAM-dependent methyltransferase